MEMARQAYVQLIEEVMERVPPRSSGVVVKKVKFLRPLVLEKGKVNSVHLVIDSSDAEEWTFEILQEGSSEPFSTGKERGTKEKKKKRAVDALPLTRNGLSRFARGQLVAFLPDDHNHILI